MHLQLATSVFAGCVVHAVADAPAAAIPDRNAAVVPSQTEDVAVLDSPTNDVAGGRARGHRLLQKFKDRRAQRANQQSKKGDSPDLGVLSRGGGRSLQTDYDYYCPRDTCPQELCDCAEDGGSLEDCTSELQSVCRAGRLADCVFRDYVKIYEEVYCPFVGCVDEGFRENQCDCAFYELYCNRLQGQECEEVLGVASDEPDNKPFFGCDETELASVCDQATECKRRGDLQGLDLGTWQGAGTVGIHRSAGEAVGGGGFAVAGVTLLSMLWLMVNA